jgi:hypothetical protein
MLSECGGIDIEFRRDFRRVGPPWTIEVSLLVGGFQDFELSVSEFAPVYEHTIFGLLSGRRLDKSFDIYLGKLVTKLANYLL